MPADRTSTRAAYPGAEDFVPDTDDLAQTADAVQQCHGCDLYQDATQGVFGQGARGARVLLLGEQPGDQEDRQGKPFVGPAGGVLDRALREAGVQRESAYVTNAVKHFRWRSDPRGGKRRIHQRPDAGHVAACRPWWLAEVRLVRPEVLVALGATAGQAMFGSSFRVGASRGTVLDWPVPDEQRWGPKSPATLPVVATIHPSAVLRAEGRDEAFAGLVRDLRTVAELLGD
jgi:DNA polymerase